MPPDTAKLHVKSYLSCPFKKKHSTQTAFQGNDIVWMHTLDSLTASCQELHNVSETEVKILQVDAL